MRRLKLHTLTFFACLGLSLATAGTAFAAPPPPPPGGAPPPPPGGKTPPPPPGDKPAVPTSGAPTAEQIAAEDELFASDRFADAARVFQPIAAGESPGDAARAQFWLGKALYQLGYFSGALGTFEQIVQSGPSHPYHQATLPWLALLSRVLPESAGVLDQVGVYKEEDLAREEFDEVRDELYYLLGRFHYQKGDTSRAIRLLGRVPDDSDFYIPAQFFLGVAETREFRGPPAVEAFKNVLRKNIELRETATASKKRKLSKRKKLKLGISTAELDFEEQNQRLEELANLYLGYIFYQVGKFEVALKYFDKVPMTSPYWLDAVFASAWSEFRLVEADEENANRHYQRTLGYIHTLNAPFFYDYLYPEALILKATTYYFNCRFSPAKQAVDEFNQRYLKTKDDLQAVIDSAPDDYELYDLTVRIREGKSNLDPFVEKVARKSLQDKTLEKNYAFVERLEFESQQLQKQPEDFQRSSVGRYIAEQLDFALGVARESTGALARDRLDGQIKEIRALEREAIKVEYEILNKLKAIDPNAVGQVGTLLKPIVDKEHEIYNYNGEYWQDELGYYNYKITSECNE